MRTNPFPLRLPRHFFLRAYSAESTTIAFRSEKSGTEFTQADMLFEEVVEMFVRPVLNDVTVSLIEGGYSLSTPDFPDGYVLCKRFHYAEDDVEDWSTFDVLAPKRPGYRRIYHPSPGP
ncbi:hypothetical protein C8D87_104139 [Lentzea atacamensis]|uniref:Uncharacterized protein n=1 Tax=Lentzea atacamensis TaxID=531938 RepID=A0ABX9E834_9PSEU|nr:hypothetical protein [Lentzea atacamensis]RAS65592.1 hypothetical protein C8D87_104139 [Lentzea atacamensis]